MKFIQGFRKEGRVFPKDHHPKHRNRNKQCGFGQNSSQGRLWTFLQSIVFTATPVYCWASIAKPVKLDSKPCNCLNNKNREKCLTSLLRAWHKAKIRVVYSGNWLAFVSCSGYHPSKPTKPWNSWKTGRGKSQKPGTSPALYKMWFLPLLHCRLRLN